MFTNLRSYIIAIALGAALWFSYSTGYDKADTKWQQEVHNEYVKKTEATADRQAAVNKVAQEYQDDLAALEGSTDRVINDLRNDGKRLRVKLKDTTRELTDNGGCLVDGRAELDEEFSKRLIGVTQKGDAWIKALQNTIKEMQNKENK